MDEQQQQAFDAIVEGLEAAMKPFVFAPVTPEQRERIRNACLEVLAEIAHAPGVVDPFTPDQIKLATGDDGTVHGTITLTPSQAAVLQAACDHAAVMPTFDAAAAAGLSVAEVRHRWPRFDGKCPNCGATLLCYASVEHYTAGGW